ncbi:MAG: hypothetical protein JF625_17610 [Inquilinus limosus]|uniref:Uncharacterized protein n=1 Tax=Inquilinus limosus TaxID=171674 RepID=A0A952FLL9_9PROT|nr:hypothetical protein [Inquilinus limosus]
MRSRLLAAGTAAAALLWGSAAPAQTADEARAFVDKAEADLAATSEYLNKASWVRATFITDDTQWLEAKANGEWTEKTSAYAQQARASWRR